MEREEKPKCLVLGTRGSRLALWQTEEVRRALKRRFPDMETEMQIIRTVGDRILNKGLAAIGDKGLFTGELEQALLKGEIDAAVHSMKDVPAAFPAGLGLAAILPRENPADVFVGRTASSIRELKKGAVIGTSSLRRRAQVKALRPDIQVVDVRGNVETRLKKMEEEKLDGILLAFAGMKRLEFANRITEVLSCEMFLPAVGQGAIGVECRMASPAWKIMQELDDTETRQCVTAERAFLARLEGGCQVPLGALAVMNDGVLTIRGRVLRLDGSVSLEENVSGTPEEAEKTGCALAEKLLAMGADEILTEIRKTGGNA